MHLIVAAGADGLQALAPKRGGAAGIGTHSAAKQVEVVLQEVRVGPDGLIGKFFSQLLSRFAFEFGNAAHRVGGIARGPRRAVASLAAQLVKHFSAALHFGLVEVAGGGNGEASVPNHESLIVVIVHFGFQRVCCARSHVEAVDGQPHLFHLGHPLFGGIEIAAVGAVHVGDVPNGVGAGAVAEPGTRVAIGPASEIGVAVFLHNRIERQGHAIAPRHLALILHANGIVGNGVEQSRAGNADSTLDIAVDHLGQVVLQEDFALVDSHHGIAQHVSLAIGERVAMLIGRGAPFDGQPALVERGFVGFHGPRLQHARKLRQRFPILIAKR